MRDISDEDFAKLHQLLVGAGLEVRKYSGRGMFGRYCLAVTLDRGGGQTMWDAAISVGSAAIDLELDETWVEAFRRPSQDSMGHGTVLYWPSLEWPASYPDVEEHADEEDR